MIKRVVITIGLFFGLSELVFGQTLLSPPSAFTVPQKIHSPEEFGRNWYTTYGSGDGQSQQEGYKIAQDHSGNFVIAGFATSEDYGTDPLVVKYDNAGNLLWSAQYTGTVHGNNEAVNLAVDANNNIYILTKFYSDSSYYDIVTVKYSPSGQQMWSRTLSGGAPGIDTPGAITIDNDGYIYITGGVYARDLTYDLEVVKYDSQGNVIWNYVFDGGTSAWVSGTDITTDDSGKVYVTGFNYHNSNYDLLVLKLDSDGNYLWDASYDNTGNAEEGRQVETNSAGDVIVSGIGYFGNNYNYLLVSFDSQGNMNWHKSVPGNSNQFPAIVLDNADNIYLAGSTTYFNGDAFVAKYTSAGNPVWDASYDDSQNSNDAFQTVTVDSSGNVYAAGYQTVQQGLGLLDEETVVIKYDSSGTLAWSAAPDTTGSYSHANDILLDHNGNVVITGFNAYPRDVDIVSFDSIGNQNFLADFSGQWRSYDRANAVTVSSAGDIIVGGYATTSTNKDFLTLKYDASGDFQWKKEFNGAANLIDEIWAVDTDVDGNVYITGSSETAANIRDFITIKYDPDGNQIWQSTYDDTLHLSDIPVDLKVNSQGDVYVCGYSDVNSSYSREVVLLKYDGGSGSLLWKRTFKGSYPDGNDMPIRMKFDSQENVVLGSWLTESTAGAINYDYAVSKFSPEGDSLWTSTYNDSSNGNDYLKDLCIGNGDNIYVTGYGKDAAGDNQIITIKYNSGGEEQWVARFDSSLGGSYGDQGTALMVDENGNVIVSGIGFVSSYNTDILLIKYDATGQQQWVTRYNNPDRVDAGDYVTGMQWMDDGSIFIAGAFSSAYPYYSMQNMNFSADGEFQYIDGFQMLTSPTEVLTSSIGCAKAPHGDIVVVGNSSSTYWNVINILSFSNSPNRIENNTVSVPQSYQLFQNYPNPFNPETTIKYSIPKVAHVSLKVYDILGREVETLVDKVQPAGNYQVKFSQQTLNVEQQSNNRNFLSSGVYFYRLRAGSFVQTKKMLMIK